MSKKKLNECRSGKDFIAYAEKHGATVQAGHGSHRIVKTSKGAAVVPFHNKDLGTGLRAKLIKLFIAIGLSVFAVVFVIHLF